MQKIKTALLSYGMSGKVFHAPFLELHEGFELTGAWERSKKLIQQDFPKVKSYASLEELLSDDATLVVVNTPVGTHYEYARQALLAGKNVVVEEAFTTTVAEAEALKQIAEEKGLKLAVFQNRRWDSDFKTVQQVIASGDLGEIVDAEIHFDRYNPKLSPKQHKETANSGAGILKDLGPHIIDQTLCLFGKPEAVFADIRITRDNSQVNDVLDILLYYPNTRVRLKASFFVKEPLPSYIFHGRKGSFLKSRGDIQEDELKLGKKPDTTENWGKEPEAQSGLLHTEKNGVDIRRTVPTLSGNYYAFYDGMYQSIVHNTKEPVTAMEGVHVMEIIEAALQSSTEKKNIIL